jgi:hypothetical protein
MSRSGKIGALCVGLLLVSFRLMIFAVEFATAHKQTLPVAAYVAQTPKGDWFELADGVLDLTQATYFSIGGKGQAHEAVFIPVFPAGDSLREEPVILLQSENSQYRDRVSNLHTISETGVIREMLHNGDKYLIKRDLIKGYRANLKDGQSNKLHEYFPTVKIILEEDGSPSYGTATVLGIVWLVLLFFLIQTIRAERTEREMERFYNEQQAAQPPADKQL